MENQGTQAQGLQGLQGTQGTQVQSSPILDIKIPTEEEIQEYNREKEERRQQALERLRNENMALPRTPSVPRPTGWESLGPKKN
jgi:uncharacterized protein YbjQ (UPF0145 family)